MTFPLFAGKGTGGTTSTATDARAWADLEIGSDAHHHRTDEGYGTGDMTLTCTASHKGKEYARSGMQLSVTANHYPRTVRAWFPLRFPFLFEVGYS